MREKVRILVASAPLLGTPLLAAEFTATRLEVPAGALGMYVSGLSDAGFSTGYSKNTDGSTSPVIWNAAGQAIRLPLPAAALSGLGYQFSGSFVVGGIRLDGEEYNRPAYWDESGGYHILANHDGGFAFGGGMDDRLVTGAILDFSQEKQIAAGWLDGVLSRLESLQGNNNYVFCANRFGKYIGVAHQLGEIFYGFSGNGGNAELLKYPELDAFHLVPYDINDIDVIVGTFVRDGPYADRGFVAIDGKAQELGRLSGMVESPVFGVNNAGTIVGINRDANGTETGVAYFGGVQATDLNSLIDPIPGLHLAYGVDVNESGQILAEGFTSRGHEYYVLSPIPEPAVAGLVVFAGLAMRRRHCPATMRNSRQDAPAAAN